MAGANAFVDGVIDEVMSATLWRIRYTTGGSLQVRAGAAFGEGGDEMDQLGQDEIGQAKQKAASEDYPAAFKIYRGVMIKFRGAPCATAAANDSASLGA